LYDNECSHQGVDSPALLYTKCDPNPYRVRAGLVPALESLLLRNTTFFADF